MRLGFDEIAECTDGVLEVAPAAQNACATGLSWDSRTVSPGDVYVALPGERVDGHEFVAAALRAGAAGAIVTAEPAAPVRELACRGGAAVVRVADALQAVADLARAWRGRLSGRVVGLTGSTGKTTTKDLVRDVLACAGPVVATLANQNNELGVPNTILAAAPDACAVVVEMGMRGEGQIEALCEVAQPDWGLVTNVGESHIELLGSRENIARAKSELLCALPDGRGMAFVNVADDMTEFLCAHACLEERGVRVVRFDGSGAPDPRADVWARNVRLDAQGRPRFVLCTREGAQAACGLALAGRHNVSNACAAAAVGLAFGLRLEQIAGALGAAQPQAGRGLRMESPRGFAVVNDAYNANPDSMCASLASFAALEVAGRRVAVLGDMGELGDFAPAAHNRVGAFAAAQALDRLVCVGDLARLIARGAQEAGMPSGRIVCVDAADDALEELDAWLAPGDAVLVKASHFMELERVVEGLVG